MSISSERRFFRRRRHRHEVSKRMDQLLKPNQTVYTEASGMPCQVEQFLGGGTQGEVYRASLGSSAVAVKWFFPDYLKADSGLRERLESAIKYGPPNETFLWPMELASAQGVPSFGYVMALRESRFSGIGDMLRRRVEPSFRALATAGFELADGYWQLHAKGLCYRDINHGNVFFDPDSGEVRICDNDNVDVNGRQGFIDGTPRFMAPEIVRGEAMPSADTDLFSLSVLLFYMLMLNHPLDGAKEYAIHAFDLPAMRKVYGTEPLFIFDPSDDSNRPVPGYHDNAIVFWRTYPGFLRDLFTRAFTDGIRDPKSGRVRETEWRGAMVRLRDSIIYCPQCGSENFYDASALNAGGEAPHCWSCKNDVPVPPRMRVGKNVVMLNHDTKLYPHHVDDTRMYDFTAPVGEVVQHPNNPRVWGLKNLTRVKWVATLADGTVKDVQEGQSVTLTVGTKLQFGKTEGEIRF